MIVSKGLNWQVAEQMAKLLEARAESLAGCTEGSEEETELAAISDVLDAYQLARQVGMLG